MKIRHLHSNRSDQELIELYQKDGQQEALGELYNRYMHLVYGLCLKYFKDEEKARDGVMDIYELLSKKLKSHQVEHFKAWLYMVSKNHCLEKLRKESTSFLKEKEAYLMYSEQVFHPDKVRDPQLLKQLKACINQLPNEQRICIEWFYLKEKSYHEICDLTQHTWNKVRSFVQNGRRNLKQCMTKK